MGLDDVYVFDEPRRRRVWPIIAVAVPVCLFAGLAAWFIRTYVAPPMVAISESLVAEASEPSAATPRAAETSGSAIAAEIPEPAPPAPPAPIFSTLAFAPLNVARPRSEVDVTTLDLPAEPALENSEPIAGPVPLPHPRPRISVASFSSAVPLPRPRPQI